jgi:hypothetical protein
MDMIAMLLAADLAFLECREHKPGLARCGTTLRSA